MNSGSYCAELIHENIIIEVANGNRDAMNTVVAYYDQLLDRYYAQAVERFHLKRTYLPEEDIKQEVRREFFRSLLRFKV